MRSVRPGTLYDRWAQRAQWFRAVEDLIHSIAAARSDGSERAGLTRRFDLACRHLDASQLKVLNERAEQWFTAATTALAASVPPPPVFRVGALLFDQELRVGLVLWLRSAPASERPGLLTLGRNVAHIAATIGAALETHGLERPTDDALLRRVDAVTVDIPPEVDVARLGGTCAGASMDLAVALHVWVELLGVARPAQLLVSGELGPQGTVLGVEEIVAKVQGALAEKLSVDRVLVPKGALKSLQATPHPGPLEGLDLLEAPDFSTAVDLLGFLPNSAELRTRCERADHQRELDPVGRRLTTALLQREITNAEANPAPNRHWADARVWRSRLAREGDAGFADHQLLLGDLLHHLGTPGHPGSATTPAAVAEAGAGALDACIDGLEWGQVDGVVRLLQASPAASILGLAAAPPDPQAAWMRAVWAPEVARLHAMIGHARLQLDRLDEADSALDEALRTGAPEEAARCHIHKARVAMRRVDIEGARALNRAASDLASAVRNIPAARAARLFDRSEANLEIVQYRFTAERTSDPQFRSHSDSRRTHGPVHDDDILPILLAEVRCAWLARDAAAWSETLVKLGHCEYALDALLLAALTTIDLRGPEDRVDGDQMISAANGHLREMEIRGKFIGRAVPVVTRDLLALHRSLRPYVEAAGDGPLWLPVRVVWRLPYLS